MTDRDAAKDDIRRALSDPGDVVRRLGLEVKGAQRQAGGGLLLRCPAPGHGDRTASCSITRGPDGTLRVRCFGCELAGDVFSLVAAVRGLDIGRDFPDVLREAGALAGVDVAFQGERSPSPRPLPRRAPEPPPFAPLAPAPIGPHDRAFAALVAPILSLGALDGGPLSVEVCDYLDRRGLLDVGRAEGWAALPPAGSAAAASWCRMLLSIAPDIAEGLFPGDPAGPSIVAGELATIVMDDDRLAFVHAAHRLVIPYRSPDGTVYTWQRRRLDPGEPKYVFPRSREHGGEEAREGRGRGARWPHGAEAIAGAPAGAAVVYCEGALDAAAVRALDAIAGRSRIVLGVPGTQAWQKGEGFFATFARDRVAFVATDVDAPKQPGKIPPGDAAAARWGADLWRAGALDVKRPRPPEGAKDWAEALTAARRTATS